MKNKYIITVLKHLILILLQSVGNYDIILVIDDIILVSYTICSKYNVYNVVLYNVWFFFDKNFKSQIVIKFYYYIVSKNSINMNFLNWQSFF